MRRLSALAVIAIFLPVAAWAAGVSPNISALIGVGDTTTPANQLKVNADGSINTSVTPAASATQGSTPAQTGAAASSLVLKSSAGNLLNLSVTIGATSGYLMVDNATAAPADGAVTPRFCVPVISNGTNGSVSLSWPLPGKYFSTGIVAVFSTTGCFTQTLSNAAFIGGDVQ